MSTNKIVKLDHFPRVFRGEHNTSLSCHHLTLTINKENLSKDQSIVTLGGLGFPDSPNTSGWRPLVFQGLARVDQQAKYRTPQMPLAACHWFSEGSKSRSQ